MQFRFNYKVRQKIRSRQLMWIRMINNQIKFLTVVFVYLRFLRKAIILVDLKYKD